MLRIIVFLPNNKSYLVFLRSHDTMATLKTVVKKCAGICSGILSLAPPRTEKGEFCTLEECGILDLCSVEMTVEFGSDTVEEVLKVSAAYLNILYHIDLTVVRDHGKEYRRGGEVYSRPYGWFRYALDVYLKYRNDGWLRSTGGGPAGSSVEWPVAYHGTAKENIGSIVQEGYKLSKCRRSTHGYGIYTTPRVDVAASYAEEFAHAGKKYKVVLQNRVNPKTVEKVTGSFRLNGQRASVPFWISVREFDVRPYGILIKEVRGS